MRRLLIVGLSLILIGFTGVSYAELTEQDISNINASLENILTQLNQGGIPEDEALAQIESIFNEQILPELPEGENVDFASLIPNIQDVFTMVTTALEGGGDVNAAIAAATESLSSILIDNNTNSNTNPNPGTSLRGGRKISEISKEGKKKEKTPSPPPINIWPTPREPTIQGSIAGIEEIDGKMYVKVEADKVNIADGNGFVDAEGEVWLVEVDKDTAAELKDKTGEKIIISGDLQEDVDGHLTISLYTKEYLKEKYGIETDTDKFYAVGNDIEKYIAEMDKEGSWFKQMEELMSPIYKAIEEKYGKELSYKEKLEILKQILFSQPSGAELIGEPKYLEK